ncbi:MAG: 1-(5-phosphoribosyl)-5-amino-4-imidazole-carboxylate carboxylase [Candidatus Raymondbacteria bacterium RIFOXYA2_FULL_49_16]|uniref:1-(5-phosphoribosyl)-5-amino-4-imidazole-carboxylate carboxylase n=1 Tax=Candidatus Raymondbacteria bacterium RIFOXYD12_FULL_49_13 TaxID=1817890 RepID=A0A1F7F0A4_UNCRA|nr:MAG: 1-(5-phosphoribosyl)-5-amino-4-imidazole-carboxylate carboxylase [Candidatus Raymondbacteria bacterium RIFOXYA2_FULL_49_16]OGK00079.1 MAG: 1-(5-phosphoribosyl)-5-amino-4-imidazole-carboxylate carboxylase [Candidatus Raymondbacteria bacterium RIFOXYD12_FULL_49_13]OGP45068.1 MAG: 1-(5-phosphoribosyl)-5-amino-4-imidazole-carboxylate carboxylase [Candidatus Raymondbacteria bacterium RIFOXYB2_FULL_49_35]
MKNKNLETILRKVGKGSLSVKTALELLGGMHFEDLGFAKVDHGRERRKGFPEVIFCQGKTPEQIKKIARSIIAHGSRLLGTRLSEQAWKAISADLPEATYGPVSRTMTYTPKGPRKKPAGSIAIVCAGTSDIPIAEEAAVTAEMLGSNVTRVYDAGVAGIHRLFAHKTTLDNARVVVVVAGMEGALASVVGGLVRVPVIAVPTSVGYGASFGGVAALLAMLNSCASGVTVVNIDNGFGAGYAASLINTSR